MEYESVSRNDADFKQIESYLYQYWSETLGVSKGEFTIDDSFESLGGSSIELYQILLKMEKLLDRRIEAEVFLHYKTIRKLMEYIRLNRAERIRNKG